MNFPMAFARVMLVLISGGLLALDYWLFGFLKQSEAFRQNGEWWKFFILIQFIIVPFLLAALSLLAETLFVLKFSVRRGSFFYNIFYGIMAEEAGFKREDGSFRVHICELFMYRGMGVFMLGFMGGVAFAFGAAAFAGLLGLMTALSSGSIHGAWEFLLALLAALSFIGAKIYANSGEIGGAALLVTVGLAIGWPALSWSYGPKNEGKIGRKAVVHACVPVVASAYMMLMAWVLGPMTPNWRDFFIAVAVIAGFEAALWLIYGFYLLGRSLVARLSGTRVARFADVLRNKVCPVVTVEVRPN